MNIPPLPDEQALHFLKMISMPNYYELSRQGKGILTISKHHETYTDQIEKFLAEFVFSDAITKECRKLLTEASEQYLDVLNARNIAKES